VRRPLLLLAVVAALAGCGGSATKPPSVAGPPGPGTVLYDAGVWAVVVDGGRATAFHRVAGTWRADRSGAVQIRILGPKPGEKVAATPQVAAELVAHSRLVESSLWVDGNELLVKGGGLTPDRGTIYGAPDAPLAPGTHVAVAYGRTGTHATAVAWTFRV